MTGFEPLAVTVGVVALCEGFDGLEPLAVVTVGRVRLRIGAAGLDPAGVEVATAGADGFFLGAAGLRRGSAAGCGRAGGCAGTLCGLGSSRRMSICRLGSSV